MRRAPSRAVKDEEILRISERRQAADDVRRDHFEDHRVFDIEIREAARDDRERDDDEERHVIRHERCEATAQRDQRERERSRVIEARDRRRDRVIEPAGVAQDLDRYKKRKKYQQQVDVDRLHRRSHADAPACKYRKCNDRCRARQQVITQEPYLLPPPPGGFYYMKPIRLAVVLVFILAVPAFAADRAFDLTAFAVYVDPNSSGTFNSPTPNQAFDINFNGKLGYGIGANIFFGNALSAEFTVASVKTEASFTGRARVFNSEAALLDAFVRICS